MPIQTVDFFSFPFASTDETGRLISANAAWCQHSSLRPGDLIYGNWSDPAAAEIMWKKVSQDLPGAGQQSLQVESGGKPIDMYFSRGCGDKANVIWVWFDGAVRSYHEIAQQAQEERMSAMAEMAAGIAHEILNPLTIIAGKTSIMQSLLEKEGSTNDLVMKCTQSIANQCTRITKIVRALRTFSRNGLQDPMESIPMQQLVDETLALCAERARSKGTKFIADPAPSGTMLHCRAVQVIQILVNLVNNAVDATKDVDFPEVHIRYRLQEGGIDIMVSDNGPGVPDAIAEKIFQPFYTTKEVGKGTGLGLSLSRRLSQDNGGNLSLDPSIGPSCFVLHLKTVDTLKKAI